MGLYLVHVLMEFPEFEEDKPAFILPCGCKGYIDWHMDLTWTIDVVVCRGHLPLPDLPEGTILIDVHAHHLQHMNDITNS